MACATTLLALGLLAVAPAAHGQEAVLEGQVVDQQDSALVGVTVELNAPALPRPVVMTTGPRGEYRFPSLPPGVYTLTFTLSWFQSAQREVTLGGGERRAVDVKLGLAPFAQQVDVVAVSPLLGAPVNREIVAATVSVIASDELSTRGAASLSSGLNERLGAVSLEDTTTNIFQPTLRFRGRYNQKLWIGNVRKAAYPSARANADTPAGRPGEGDATHAEGTRQRQCRQRSDAARARRADAGRAGPGGRAADADDGPGGRGRAVHRRARRGA